MKKLLVGLLALTSVSVMSNGYKCNLYVDNPSDRQGITLSDEADILESVLLKKGYRFTSLTDAHFKLRLRVSFDKKALAHVILFDMNNNILEEVSKTYSYPGPGFAIGYSRSQLEQLSSYRLYWRSIMKSKSILKKLPSCTDIVDGKA